mgnify:CR=1 FL=1|tara:strand:+ start:8255 stop:8467 length:213 start_codon:yes stop_codon:yes gene_type:complete
MTRAHDRRRHQITVRLSLSELAQLGGLPRRGECLSSSIRRAALSFAALTDASPEAQPVIRPAHPAHKEPS